MQGAEIRSGTANPLAAHCIGGLIDRHGTAIDQAAPFFPASPRAYGQAVTTGPTPSSRVRMDPPRPPARLINGPHTGPAWPPHCPGASVL